METQLKHLPRLLMLSKKFGLPMFMHDRHPEAHADFVRILKEVGYGPDWPGGVVHSFTGTVEEMKQMVSCSCAEFDSRSIWVSTSE